MRISRFGVGVLAVATLATTSLAACSSSKSSGGEKVPKGTEQSSVGTGEGKLNIIAWAGYAEDGTNDPKVDWVHPFE
jgi:putative spermidine/putrescine transport system substrate-binding protein